ncbi:SixA phosphatase family protein [Shewanella livingstonensis]|uniref:Histidine phosphatase family protein n=1 Tax=Shewanella livingstonensis TaxID=150120 RepID=A0A3G8LTQ7_9GAMM|nr:histidine phosphatase family protein [Shewanella livingstonensis]AZG73006.1 histidine phosphatase family protein [Shewanella livingstonensis]
MRQSTTRILIGFMSLISVSLMAQSPVTAQVTLNNATSNQVIFIVRHAEKLDGKDPDLSEQGKLRALRLATVLSSTSLNKVYSTDYNRTRETATAVTQDQQVELSIYDPRDMAAFTQQLLTEQGNILVVGHSNTSTGLVEGLGADKQLPIDDASEFDRLYIVTLNANKQMVSTVLLRY